MIRITTVVSGTGKYEICKNEHGYWAIEHEYIGADGRLAAPINGIQGGLSETYEQAVNTAVFRGKVKEYDETNPTATPEQRLQYMAQVI